MLLPKYAKWEVERRFLVDPSKLPPLDSAAVRTIDDLYLVDTRLRLRSIVAIGADPEYKLCKKYASPTGEPQPVVNIYLTAREHALLAALPGLRLRKRRYRLIERGLTFGVDVFEDTLKGLALAEVEAETPAQASAIAAPVWTVREVTADPFFSGGSLCRISSAELAERLAAEGL